MFQRLTSELEQVRKDFQWANETLNKTDEECSTIEAKLIETTKEKTR